MNILYKRKKILSKTLLFEESGVVYYHKITPFEKNIYQIPVEALGNDVSFSRGYHAPFFIPVVFLSFLSIRLIIKKWSVGDWTLYLGLSVLAFMCCGLVYYATVGKKTGEVELNFGDNKLSILMKKENYMEFKEKFDALKQSKDG